MGLEKLQEHRVTTGKIRKMDTKFGQMCTGNGNKKKKTNSTVMAETKRERIEINAGTRAIKYKEKVRYWRTDTLEGECLRLLHRSDVKSRLEEERKNFIEKRGWSNVGLTIKMYTDDCIRIIWRKDV